MGDSISSNYRKMNSGYGSGNILQSILKGFTLGSQSSHHNERSICWLR